MEIIDFIISRVGLGKIWSEGLLTACKYGKKDVFEKLRTICPVDMKTTARRIIASGNFDLFSSMLDLSNIDLETLVTSWCEAGNLEEVKNILDGPMFGKLDWFTPLALYAIAANKCDVEMMKYFVEKFGEPQGVVRDYCIECACRFGDYEMNKYLKPSRMFNATHYIIHACIYGQVEFVEKILELYKGCNINWNNVWSGVKFECNLELLHFLEKKGIDCKVGFLKCVAQSGNHKDILSAVAELKPDDPEWKSIFWGACLSNDIDTLKYVISLNPTYNFEWDEIFEKYSTKPDVSILKFLIQRYDAKIPWNIISKLYADNREMIDFIENR